LLLQEPDVNFGVLTERYGAAATRRIWEASHEAARDLVAVLRRLKIACALSERPSVYYTTKTCPTSARLLLEQWQGRVSGDHELFAFGR